MRGSNVGADNACPASKSLYVALISPAEGFLKEQCPMCGASLGAVPAVRNELKVFHCLKWMSLLQLSRQSVLR